MACEVDTLISTTIWHEFKELVIALSNVVIIDMAMDFRLPYA